MAIKIVFSDIDGTLAHYPKHFADFGEITSEEGDFAVYKDKTSGEERKCRILTSLTAGNAYVSEKSIELIEDLRSKGVIFVLISGARKSTFLKRLPLLPEADIGIAENGGRIYDRGVLDREWSATFEDITGDIETSEPVTSRKGSLWKLFRTLEQDGWAVDSREYYAGFRLNIQKSEGKTESEFKSVLADLPEGIVCSFNLGKADFYPAVSGKGNAVKYILEKEGIDPSEAVALMDDDNDLPMAEAVGTVMIPGITHDSVREAITEHPEWIVAQEKGILGYEELLEEITRLRDNEN